MPQLPASQHTPFSHITPALPNQSPTSFPPLEPQPIPLIQRLRLSKQNLQRQITILTYLPIVLEQQMAQRNLHLVCGEETARAALYAVAEGRGYLGPWIRDGLGWLWSGCWGQDSCGSSGRCRILSGLGVDGWVGHVVAVYDDLLAFGYDGAVGEDDGTFGFAAHCYCLV